MSPTWTTFLFEAANFLLLAAVLGWLFFRPVRAALERRRASLEQERKAAQEARAEAERALAEARARQAEAEATLPKLHEEARREAEAERKQLLDEARAQIGRERAAFQHELDAMRRAQARSMIQDAAAAAREIVANLLAELGTPDLERALLERACHELERLRTGASLGKVVVESARDLPEDALAAIAEAAAIPTGEIQHRIDPSLTAGLRILTAGGLVDLSVAGLAAQAERALVRGVEEEGPEHG